MVCICFSLFLVGVYAATSVDLTVTSSVSFKSNGTFVMATGQVYRGSSSTFTDSDKLLESDRPADDMTVEPSYSYKGHSYNPVSADNDEPDGTLPKDFTGWTIGKVEFLSSEPFIKYEINMKNYGESEVIVNIEGLQTNIEGLEIAPSMSTSFTIAPSETETFYVLFELKDFTKSFDSTAFSFTLNIQKNVTEFIYSYVVENAVGGGTPSADKINEIFDYYELYDDGVKVNLVKQASGTFTVEDGSFLEIKLVGSNLNNANLDINNPVMYAPEGNSITLSIYNSENERIFWVSYGGVGGGGIHTNSTYTVNGK